MKAVVGVVIVFIMVLLSAHSSLAQGKFSLSISGAPTYSYANVRRNVLLPTPGGSTVLIPDFTTKTMGYGYTAGVMGKYEFVPRWSVSTGVWMSYNRTEPPTIQSGTPVDLSVGQSRSRHYQVPVLINFQSSTQRLSPYFSAGVLLSFRSPTYVDVGNNQEVRFRLDRNDVTVVPTVGVGAIYRMSKYLSLAVQPTVNYYLPQGTYSSYFSGRASLQTQVFYTF